MDEGVIVMCPKCLGRGKKIVKRGAEFIQGHESLFSIVGHSIYRRRGN